MLLFLKILAALNSSAELFITTLKRDLTKKKVHPLITTSISNVVGHPLILIVLLALWQFVLPGDPRFYISFSLLVFFAMMWFYFTLIGYARSMFSAATFVHATGVMFTVLGGVVFLGERLSWMQSICVIVTIVWVSVLSLPKKVRVDRGILFVLLGTLFGSIGTLFYRLSATLVPEYHVFLSGRLVVDAGLLSVLLFVLFRKYHGSVSGGWKHFFSHKNAKEYVIMTVIRSLITSYLIFQLPATTMSMIGTLTLPFSFLLGRMKYREKPKWEVWIGSTLIFIGILVFILSPSI